MLKTKVPTNKPHFRLIFFYRRAHEVNLYTEREARNFLKARALVSTATHYSELWKMSNDEDGEQVALFENSDLELTLK